MIKKNLLLLFASVFATASSFAQGTEMADALKESGKIYVVVAVLAIIFSGIVIYLINIDRKLSKLEEQLRKQQEQDIAKKD